MNKSDIENSLRKKFDDEYTIKMFTNYVLEFQECFADIISTEEVVKRLINSINGNIVFMDELPNKNLDGQYSKDRYIKLKTSAAKDEEYCKYLLFPLFKVYYTILLLTWFIELLEIQEQAFSKLLLCNPFYC